MRRLLPLLTTAWLLLAVMPMAPAALADEPTATPDTVTLDTGTEPLVPYIVALLVMSAVLMVVGLIAMQVNRRSSAGARSRRRDTWWTCATCTVSNAGDRDTCYACGAGRAR